MSLPKSPNDTFIGKYRVVQFIGAGGMAEVWLCRRSSIGGFEKPVVIKRILPTYAADPEFTRMFLDEARVAAGLNHPNIVQLYDIDSDNDVPFMAMEYVNGPSFQAMLNRARKAGEVGVGIATAVRIVSDVAAGLQYAHTASDADGEPLGLVHRDISPHNILVSSEGMAKLLDFGVAKSRGRLTSTQAGVIKGKFSHMAPEQARSEDVDLRADVYSLGVCLYEATTGRLPFLAENDVQRIVQIVNGDFPRPSLLVPSYPPRLEQIVLAAMHVDREQRTPSAQAFRDALEAFAAAEKCQSSNTGVSRRVAELFPQGEVVPGPQASGLTPTPSSNRFLNAYRSSPRSVSHEELAALTGGKSAPPVPDGAAADSSFNVDMVTGTQAVPITVLDAARPTQPRRAGPVIAAVAGLAVLSVAVFVMTRSAPPAAPAVIAAPARDGRDDAARTALDEARRLVQERRFGVATEVLNRAKEKPATDAALNLQVLKLLDTVETESALEKARTLLGAKDFEGAQELANAALAREPGNLEAVRVLGEARALKAVAIAPPPVAKPVPAPAAKAAPRPAAPAATKTGFDSDSLLPSDPDTLLPPTNN